MSEIKGVENMTGGSAIKTAIESYKKNQEKQKKINQPKKPDLTEEKMFGPRVINDVKK